MARALVSGESLWAAFVLTVGFGAYRLATTMPPQQAHDPLGGRFIPVLIAVSLMGAASAVLARTLFTAIRTPAVRTAAAPAEADASAALLDRPIFRVGMMTVIAIVFIGIMDQYRFVPGAVVGMGASMWLLGERRPSRLVVVPIITAIIVFMIFTRLLLVRLP